MSIILPKRKDTKKVMTFTIITLLHVMNNQNTFHTSSKQFIHEVFLIIGYSIEYDTYFYDYEDNPISPKQIEV